MARIYIVGTELKSSSPNDLNVLKLEFFQMESKLLVSILISVLRLSRPLPESSLWTEYRTLDLI